ncbi:MAG: hypothetical protein H0T88_02260 [Lysobacter sp.]|nr:hypothetical protein [Lysobacter sp.]
MAKKPMTPLTVDAIKHNEVKRKNIPTAEYQSVLAKHEQSPVRVAYERRNRDLDPQLVWRGKDEQDWSDLIVHAQPVYIQGKAPPKVLIDDLRRQSEQTNAVSEKAAPGYAPDLPDDNARTEFYHHDAHWANRVITGTESAGERARP